MRKKRRSTGTIQNRRARFDYELGDNLTVGIALNGRETKALRYGQGNLRGSHVVVKNSELWLINASISSGRGIVLEENETTRNRKLLANKREIAALEAGTHQGRTIVPTKIITKGRYIKLRLALGKGKKHYDKRETIKRREQDREARASIKSQ